MPYGTCRRADYKTSRQYYNIVNDLNLVSTSALYNLIKKFRVSPNWLFQVEGEISEMKGEQIEDLMQSVKKLITINQELARDKRLMSDMLTKQYGIDLNKDLSDDEAIKQLKRLTEGN